MTSGGYVGLSVATLLAQHHKVTAVDIVPEKVELINNKKSPIQDEYIEKYLAKKELELTATLDAKEAYSDADFVVIAAPTNYDSKAELKSIDKEIARIEAKKVKAETKAAESAKKAEAEDVLKKLLASGVSADEILEKLK